MQCPICKSDTRARGSILHPNPTFVAHVPIDLSGIHFTLRQCVKCGFQFKDPPIPAERLNECYQAAKDDCWEVSPSPRIRRFDELLRVVSGHASGKRILDVGCFNGAMLSYFGDSWERYGIEPSTSASRLAEERGVKILGPTLDSLADETFDVITAIDVVEHIPDPVPFFQQLADHVAPGGILVLLTGNTSALAWRLQGSKYWYCSLPEHVSFYNRASIDAIAGRVGLTMRAFMSARHKRTPVSRWCSDAAKSSIFVACRAVGAIGRRGPSIQSARDHLICVLAK